MKRTLLIIVLLLVSLPGLAVEVREAIHEDASLVQPLLPGMQAPAFTVRNAQDKPVAFDPGNMEKPLVLTFYRGGWCPYCNLHLAEMRQAEEELERLGYDIWFLSIDKPEVLYESLMEPDIGYVVLSDAKLEATRAFGIAFRVPDDVVDKYLEYGLDLEEVSGQTHHVLPAPSTYIIGADGVIRFQYTNPNYAVRLHPDVLLAAARGHAADTDKRLGEAYRKLSEQKAKDGD